MQTVGIPKQCSSHSLSKQQREKITAAQKTLNSINWKRIYWLAGTPDCPLYEGDSLCRYWFNWILGGRIFYSDNEEGNRVYAEKIKRKVPRLKTWDLQHVLNKLEEARKSPISRFFYFPEAKK